MDLISADTMKERSVEVEKLKSQERSKMLTDHGPFIRERIYGTFKSAIGKSTFCICMSDYPDALVSDVLARYIRECNQLSKQYKYDISSSKKEVYSGYDEMWQTYGTVYTIHVSQFM